MHLGPYFCSFQLMTLLSQVNWEYLLKHHGYIDHRAWAEQNARGMHEARVNEMKYTLYERHDFDLPFNFLFPDVLWRSDLSATSCSF